MSLICYVKTDILCWCLCESRQYSIAPNIIMYYTSKKDILYRLHNDFEKRSKTDINKASKLD